MRYRATAYMHKACARYVHLVLVLAVSSRRSAQGCEYRRTAESIAQLLLGRDSSNQALHDALGYLHLIFCFHCMPQTNTTMS